MAASELDSFDLSREPRGLVYWYWLLLAASHYGRHNGALCRRASWDTSTLTVAVITEVTYVSLDGHWLLVLSVHIEFHG